MSFEKEMYDLFLMQQVQASIYSVYNKVQTMSDKEFHKISSRQYMTLLAITHLRENQSTINTVAQKLGTTKQNARQLLTTLEKKGYVEIGTSNLDKRASIVKITRVGIEELMKASEIGINFLAKEFYEFSTEELELFWKLLKKLYRFDGNEMSGFEEDPSDSEQYPLSKGEKEMQYKVLESFAIERKKHRKVENSSYEK